MSKNKTKLNSFLIGRKTCISATFQDFLLFKRNIQTIPYA